MGNGIWNKCGGKSTTIQMVSCEIYISLGSPHGPRPPRHLLRCLAVRQAACVSSKSRRLDLERPSLAAIFLIFGASCFSASTKECCTILSMLSPGIFSKSRLLTGLLLALETSLWCRWRTSARKKKCQTISRHQF